MSLVSVVCCQVDVSATGRSLAQRSSTDCGVSNERDREDLQRELGRSREKIIPSSVAGSLCTAYRWALSPQPIGYMTISIKLSLKKN